MPLLYKVIEIFTSESARCEHKPLHEAIVQFVRNQKIAARCVVTRAIGGCYESGEVATRKIEVLSFNMPLKIEIILPEAELDKVLPTIERMVEDGIVVVEDMEIRCHKTRKRLIPAHMRVADAMTVNPATVTPSGRVSDVVRLLLSSSFNGIPVVDEAMRPVGIITQGDLIARAGVPLRLGLLPQFGDEKVNDLIESLAHKKAYEVMTGPVTVIAEDKLLTDAVDLMLDRSLKRLPVVDSSGKLAGILTRLDVFRTITNEAPDWKGMMSRNVEVQNIHVVGDVMRRDTHTALPETPIEEVMKVIDSNDIQRVAVVSAAGTLLGLIADHDLLSYFSAHHAGLWDHIMSKMTFLEAGRRHKAFLEHARARTASEVMTTNLITVQEETTVEDAIRLMVEKKLKRLPVVDPDGVFKGMISRDSLLRMGLT